MCQSLQQTGNCAAGNKQHFEVLSSYQTRVETDSNGRSRVIYYQTPVVTFDARTIVLNTGGWWTYSTKSRMNQASREFGLGFQVTQKPNGWFIKYQDKVQPFDVDCVTLERTYDNVQTTRMEGV